MTCSYRRPAEDGFPETGPCGLNDYYEGLCWIHATAVYVLHPKTNRRRHLLAKRHVVATPKGVRFPTAPLKERAFRLARSRNMEMTEMVPESLRRVFYKPTAGIVAIDRACTALGLHATELYGSDFYQGLEEASR